MRAEETEKKTTPVCNINLAIKGQQTFDNQQRRKVT